MPVVKREFRPRRGAERERVGRYLHHDSVCSPRRTISEKSFCSSKVSGVVRSVSNDGHRRSCSESSRSRPTFAPSVFSSTVFEKIRDRRLAVCAGHAEHRHFIRRVAEPRLPTQAWQVPFCNRGDLQRTAPSASGSRSQRIAPAPRSSGLGDEPVARRRRSRGRRQTARPGCVVARVVARRPVTSSSGSA